MPRTNSSKKGKRGQGIALNALKRIGVFMPEEIGTPFTITGTKVVHGRTYLAGFHGAKVIGDIHGHRTDGVAVLAEVKNAPGNLTWSIMKKHGEHQAANLDKHAIHAISLIVWVRDEYETYILQWPVPDFGPGKSVTPERAAELNVTNIDNLPGRQKSRFCNCEYCRHEAIDY